MIQDFVAAFSERAHRTGLGRLEFYIKENSGRQCRYMREVERLELASETHLCGGRIPRLQRFHFH